MVNPGEPSAEDRDDWTDHLVRPYVIDSDDAADGAPEDPVGNSAPGRFSLLLEPAEASASDWPKPARASSRPAGASVHDTAPLPVDVRADVRAGHRRPGGRAGRRLAQGAAPRKWYLTLAVYRLGIVIGGAIVIVTFVGGVLLLVLPDHSVTTLAVKCLPSQSGCHQIAAAAPGTVAPVTAPSASAYLTTAATLPAASRAATSETTARQATATAPATATAGRSVAPTGTPSATATASRPRPSPTPTTPGLTPGSTISIRATTACCTSYYIRHDDNDNRVVITQVTPGDSATTKADATWIVRTGLANGSCISFESANDPGQYLSANDPGQYGGHQDFGLYLDPDDGSPQFAHDATFCPQPGNSGRGYSFQSVNYPDKYIRHYDYVVYLASDGGQNPWDNPKLWPDDSSWLVSQPWG
jgi:Alpha-L-arabinofuranosidase B (ABFB) domain